MVDNQDAPLEFVKEDDIIEYDPVKVRKAEEVQSLLRTFRGLTSEDYTVDEMFYEFSAYDIETLSRALALYFMERRKNYLDFKSKGVKKK